MSDFWKSYDITAAEYGAGYECYPLFGTVHLIELALSALFLLGMVWWYRRSTPRTRRHILVGFRLPCRRFFSCWRRSCWR